MRQAGGSTDLKPSIRQHAQDQHEGNAYRKGVGTDKKFKEMHVDRSPDVFSFFRSFPQDLEIDSSFRILFLLYIFPLRVVPKFFMELANNSSCSFRGGIVNGIVE